MQVDKTMKYAIKVLEDEKRIIDKCLSSFDKTKYPDSLVRQVDKSKTLDMAITILKSI